MSARSERGQCWHPWFAKMYGKMSAVAEAKGGAEHRRELLAGVAGRVVEVGSGPGINFSYYPDTVTELVAVEPEPHLRAQADVAARAETRFPITVLDGFDDALPVDDASCDVGVASLVLCSVPNQARALAELRRVIRPGGELRFYEHVKADTPGLAAAQWAVDVVWPYMAAGCHTDRATVAAITAAGFEIETCRNFRFVPAPPAFAVAPHVIGTARRPADQEM